MFAEAQGDVRSQQLLSKCWGGHRKRAIVGVTCPQACRRPSQSPGLAFSLPALHLEKTLKQKSLFSYGCEAYASAGW